MTYTSDDIAQLLAALQTLHTDVVQLIMVASWVFLANCCCVFFTMMTALLATQRIGGGSVHSE